MLALVSHLNDQTKYYYIYNSSLNFSIVFTNKQYMEFFKSLKFYFFIHYFKLVKIVFSRLNSQYYALPCRLLVDCSFILNFIFIKFYVLISQKNIQNLFLHIQRNFTSNLFSIKTYPGNRIA